MDFVHIFIYWVTNNKFVTFFNFYFSIILCYFLQHCLYFLVRTTCSVQSCIFRIYSICNIIDISLNTGQSNIHIYSIYDIINIIIISIMRKFSTFFYYNIFILIFLYFYFLINILHNYKYLTENHFDYIFLISYLQSK